MCSFSTASQNQTRSRKLLLISIASVLKRICSYILRGIFVTACWLFLCLYFSCWIPLYYSSFSSCSPTSLSDQPLMLLVIFPLLGLRFQISSSFSANGACFFVFILTVAFLMNSGKKSSKDFFVSQLLKSQTFKKALKIIQWLYLFIISAFTDW